MGCALRRPPPRLRRRGRGAGQFPHRHRGVAMRGVVLRGVVVPGAVAQLGTGEPVPPGRHRTVPRQPLAVRAGSPGAGPPRSGAQPGDQPPDRRAGAGDRARRGEQVRGEVHRAGQRGLQGLVDPLGGGRPGHGARRARGGTGRSGGRGARRPEAVHPRCGAAPGQPLAVGTRAPCGGPPQQAGRAGRSAGDTEGVVPGRRRADLRRVLQEVEQDVQGRRVDRHVVLPPGKSCRGRGRDRGQGRSYGRRRPATPVCDTSPGARDPTVVRAPRTGRSPPPGRPLVDTRTAKDQVRPGDAGRSPRRPRDTRACRTRLVG